MPTPAAAAARARAGVNLSRRGARIAPGSRCIGRRRCRGARAASVPLCDIGAIDHQPRGTPHRELRAARRDGQRDGPAGAILFLRELKYRAGGGTELEGREGFRRVQAAAPAAAAAAGPPRVGGVGQ